MSIERLCYLIHKRNLANSARRNAIYAIYRVNKINDEKKPIYIQIQSERHRIATKQKSLYKKEIKDLSKSLGLRLRYDSSGFTEWIRDQVTKKVLVNRLYTSKTFKDYHDEYECGLILEQEVLR